MGKVNFIFGVHNHQPTGNFDEVFRLAVKMAYRPFLASSKNPAFYLLSVIGLPSSVFFDDEERCHFGALRNEKDGLTVDTAKCLGCGLCVSACPTEALSMEVRQDPPAVPKTMQEMAMTMLQEKGKLERFIEIMQK